LHIRAEGALDDRNWPSPAVGCIRPARQLFGGKLPRPSTGIVLAAGGSIVPPGAEPTTPPRRPTVGVAMGEDNKRCDGLPVATEASSITNGAVFERSAVQSDARPFNTGRTLIDARTAETWRSLTHRAADRLDVAVPDQGMHLVAYLCDGSSYIAIEAAAIRAGIVVRAISRFYRAARPRPGLMLGFSGFPRQLIVPSAARLAVLAGRVEGNGNT
jgi:hypothetical protein